MLTEAEALRILKRHLATTYRPTRTGTVRLGIGDDAAVVRIAGQQVISNDACNEGTHFLRRWVSAQDLAHKSFHSALSDLPAMGARPKAAICHLGLAKWVDRRFLASFAKEQAEVARAARCAIVGGNVSFGDSLQIVTTVLGELKSAPLCQSGARPGDEVWLLGELGLARAGYRLLELGIEKASGPQGRCLLAFRRPQARVSSGIRLLGRANACIDVSDGLAADSETLARASGVRLVFSESSLERVTPSALREVAHIVSEPALRLLVLGGEDYALLACGPARLRPRGARPVGSIEEGRGVFVRDERGKRSALRRAYGG